MGAMVGEREKGKRVGVQGPRVGKSKDVPRLDGGSCVDSLHFTFTLIDGGTNYYCA